MSVHVLYRSNYGNNFFQYVAGRLLSEKTGLALATPWRWNDFARADFEKRGEEINKGLTVLTDEDAVLDKTWPKGRYVLDGYFQVSRWYHRERKRIRSFFMLPQVTPAHPEDLVVSLRIGRDYRQMGWRIDPEWYVSLLMKMAFGRLHIVTDVEDREYLSHFDPWAPIYGGGSPLQDWNYLRRFRRVICANSTFSWWACFLGDAEDVTTFAPWVPHSAVEIGAFPGGRAMPGSFEKRTPS